MNNTEEEEVEPKWPKGKLTRYWQWKENTKRPKKKILQFILIAFLGLFFFIFDFLTVSRKYVNFKILLMTWPEEPSLPTEPQPLLKTSILAPKLALNGPVPWS